MDLPGTTEGGVFYGINPGGQGAIDFSIAADPNNANIVYVGGDQQPGPFPNSVGASSGTGRLFRGDASKPAGTQWTPLTNTATASGSAPHADSRDMTVDELGRLIEVDDGGVYVRTNPQSNAGDWFSLNEDLQVGEVPRRRLRQHLQHYCRRGRTRAPRNRPPPTAPSGGK